VGAVTLAAVAALTGMCQCLEVGREQAIECGLICEHRGELSGLLLKHCHAVACMTTATLPPGDGDNGTNCTNGDNGQGSTTGHLDARRERHVTLSTETSREKLYEITLEGNYNNHILRSERASAITIQSTEFAILRAGCVG
jgi:hypothetical protein